MTENTRWRGIKEAEDPPAAGAAVDSAGTTRITSPTSIDSLIYTWPDSSIQLLLNTLNGYLFLKFLKSCPFSPSSTEASGISVLKYQLPFLFQVDEVHAAEQCDVLRGSNDLRNIYIYKKK